jgi:hypothetical protein
MGLHIPGLAEAQAQEREWHDYAFLPLGLPIAGIDTAHLTLERAHLLMQSRSPFLSSGAPITAPSMVTFLWIVSTEWDHRATKAQRDTFYFAAAKLPLADALKGIREYMRLELADLDVTDDAGAFQTMPPWSWVVSLIDQLGAEYGWSPHVIMRQIPIGMIFQLCRRIAVRHGEPMPDGPLATKAKREFLESVNSRRN